MIGPFGSLLASSMTLAFLMLSHDTDAYTARDDALRLSHSF